MTAFLLELADAVRDAVRPWVRGLRGSEIVSESAHGDATFGIDAEAERVVAAFLEAQGRPFAVYSESTGLRTYGASTAETLLIIDPIDGTRNASCGFEGCMVSVAAAPLRDGVTLGDVTHGVLVDIVHALTFTAERGAGVTVTDAGVPVSPPQAQPVPLDRLRWSLNVPARPAALLLSVMGELIDATSLTGSFHAGNSSTFSLSRIVTGQLHAHVDFVDRIYVDYPASASLFRPVGDTHLTGSQPHDLAACMLILEEHGGIVTDAWGRSLHGAPLLAEGRDAMLSTVAAGHPTVHAELMAYVDAHVTSVTSLWPGETGIGASR